MTEDASATATAYGATVAVGPPVEQEQDATEAPTPEEGG